MALHARTNAALALPGAVLFALCFALPGLAIFANALGDGGTAFSRVLGTPGFARALAGSAALTLVAAALSTSVGVAVALYLSRLSEKRRTLLSFVIALPLTFSGLIVAYGFILGYGRVNFDRAQLAAAESLGATSLQSFRQVLLPQVAAPMIASFFLAAAVVFGAYGTALALVGTQLPILPLRLYSLISETGSDFPAAAALALVITATCSAMLATGEWIGAKHERYL
jgi:putative spermidine/putrescine transport system permease protein